MGGDQSGRVKLVRRLIQWSRGEMVVVWTKRMMTQMEKSEAEGGQEGGQTDRTYGWAG